MTKPIFLETNQVIEIYKKQIKFGGEVGFINYCLLESAVNAPKMKYELEDCKSIFLLSSIYATRIAQNHPFFDGNKRTALNSALMFLKLNGKYIDDPKNKLMVDIQRVVEKKINEDKLAHILFNKRIFYIFKILPLFILVFLIIGIPLLIIVLDGYLLKCKKMWNKVKSKLSKYFS